MILLPILLHLPSFINYIKYIVVVFVQPLVSCKSYQLSVFFYSYKVPQEECPDHYIFGNISLASNIDPSPVIEDPNVTSASSNRTNHFKFGYDESLNGMNPLTWCCISQPSMDEVACQYSNNIVSINY